MMGTLMMATVIRGIIMNTAMNTHIETPASAAGQALHESPFGIAGMTWLHSLRASKRH